MNFNLKRNLVHTEIIFNSVGQIFVNKRMIFNFVIKFFRYIPNKY